MSAILKFSSLYEPFLPYDNNRYLLNTYENYKTMLERELTDLDRNWVFKKSCGEEDLVKYVE
jgi:hypothetical protein